MARRTRAEAGATRELLLDAAEQVLFERGYANTSLEQIARHAGMTRGAIYWHFRDKADVFNALAVRVSLPLDELVEKMEQETSARPLATLRALCLYALRELARNPRSQRVYTVLLHRLEKTPASVDALAHIHEAEARALDRFEQLFARARECGDLAESMAPRTAAWALQTYVRGIYSSWLREPEAFALEENAAALLDVFFNGLPPGAARTDEEAAGIAPRGRTT
jgi:TetR/AcrR family transcriptional repressor of mexAB-oprM operon